MFESEKFSKSLDSDVFDQWLEQGRQSRLGYQYMLVVWQVLEEDYKPIYLENRNDYAKIIDVSNLYETIVAAYDLYSESKIELAD